MEPNEREYYHKFRQTFYPGGTRNEAAFEGLAYLIAEGWTDAQLGTYYGVSRITIGNWKRNHPEILEVFTANLATPDDGVERALYERARGYQVVETKVFVVDGVLKTVDVIKQYPPDTTAAIYWLNNRRKGKWRSTVHNTNEEVPPAPAFDYSKLTEAQQDEFERLLSLVTVEQDEHPGQ